MTTQAQACGLEVFEIKNKKSSLASHDLFLEGKQLSLRSYFGSTPPWPNAISYNAAQRGARGAGGLTPNAVSYNAISYNAAHAA